MLPAFDSKFGGEVIVIIPPRFEDNRGNFRLTLQRGYPIKYGVREMYTTSKRNVLRGLHLQLDPPMSKLIEVVHGSAYLVAVDMRPDSKTFLQYHAVVATRYLQVWASAGFARGYLALEDDTTIHYICDSERGEERIVAYNDPRIGVKWPLGNEKPILSQKDAEAACER
jgi:dTDP-4-dehydrorhamnose 3,5-epimerase